MKYEISICYLDAIISIIKVHNDIPIKLNYISIIKFTRSSLILREQIYSFIGEELY